MEQQEKERLEEEKQLLLRRTAKKVVNLRDRLNVGQEEFADLVGVSRATVGNWEQGVTPLKVEYAIRISKLCGVSLDELFMGVARICTAKLSHVTEKESEVILQGLDKLAGKDKPSFDRQVNWFLRLKEGLE